jgi:hypothetical protein
MFVYELNGGIYYLPSSKGHILSFYCRYDEYVIVRSYPFNLSTIVSRAFHNCEPGVSQLWAERFTIVERLNECNGKIKYTGTR